MKEYIVVIAATVMGTTNAAEYIVKSDKEPEYDGDNGLLMIGNHVFNSWICILDREEIVIPKREVTDEDTSRQ